MSFDDPTGNESGREREIRLMREWLKTELSLAQLDFSEPEEVFLEKMKKLTDATRTLSVFDLGYLWNALRNPELLFEEKPFLDSLSKERIEQYRMWVYKLAKNPRS